MGKGLVGQLVRLNVCFWFNFSIFVFLFVFFFYFFFTFKGQAHPNFLKEKKQPKLRRGVGKGAVSQLEHLNACLSVCFCFFFSFVVFCLFVFVRGKLWVECFIVLWKKVRSEWALTCTTNKVVIQLASSNVSLQFCVILWRSSRWWLSEL